MMLAVIDDEAGYPGHRRRQHLQPERGRGHGGRTVRRARGRDQPDFTEAKCGAKLERGAQVAEVHRVEAAPKNAGRRAAVARSHHLSSSLARMAAGPA